MKLIIIIIIIIISSSSSSSSSSEVWYVRGFGGVAWGKETNWKAWT